MHQPAWSFFRSDENTMAQEIHPNGSFTFSEIMQYTGIKDKFVKYIYEGDIIYAPMKNEFGIFNVYRSAVEWSDNLGMFLVWFAEDGGRMGFEFYKFMVEEIEVVGNIYENPELLNG